MKWRSSARAGSSIGEDDDRNVRIDRSRRPVPNDGGSDDGGAEEERGEHQSVADGFILFHPGVGAVLQHKTRTERPRKPHPAPAFVRSMREPEPLLFCFSFCAAAAAPTMAGGEIDPGQVEELLRQVRSPELRNQTAAALSKVAAKAEDDILLRLSEFAADFVSWLDADEPLVRASTASILENDAFHEHATQRVLDANGVEPLVRMLKSKSGEDKKVTLHSTAAVQNLTYKNTLCCQEVLEAGGEKALKKLLQHKSDDVQQFAAGALANLQLYRKKEDDAGSGRGAMRKVAKILGARVAAAAVEVRVRRVAAAAAAAACH